MSDFFGGILDDLRPIGDSVSNFFDGLQQFSGANTANTPKLAQEQTLSMGQQKEGFYGYNNVDPFNYRHGVQNNETKGVDFNTLELQWIRRLQKFSDLTIAQQDTKVNPPGSK